MQPRDSVSSVDMGQSTITSVVVIILSTNDGSIAIYCHGITKLIASSTIGSYKLLLMRPRDSVSSVDMGESTTLDIRRYTNNDGIVK